MPNDMRDLSCLLSSVLPKSDKLQDIYYQPNYLWKGQKTIRKLRDLSKERKDHQSSRNGCLDKLSGKYTDLLQSMSTDLITK